jgi:hypothetical protein
MTPASSTPDRFAAKYEVDPGSGCWLWTASRMPNGYAQFRYSPTKNGYGHRYAYELHIGPIPEGATLDHLCRVRHCVNPAHLEVVTQRENVMRGQGEAAKNAKKTHCKNGHPLSGDNLYVSSDGRHRVCRTCNLAAQQRWREQHREKYNAYQKDYQRKVRDASPEKRARDVAANKRWREQNREAYRAYERERKRKERADAKAWRESQQSAS